MILLILLYSSSMIVAEPRSNREICLAEAKERIGEEFKPTYWDYGFKLPKVVIAFCTEGYGE